MLTETISKQNRGLTLSSTMSQFHICFGNTEDFSLHFLLPEHPTKHLNLLVKIYTQNSIDIFLKRRLKIISFNPLHFKDEKIKARKGDSPKTTQ